MRQRWVSVAAVSLALVGLEAPVAPAAAPPVTAVERSIDLDSASAAEIAAAVPVPVPMIVDRALEPGPVSSPMAARGVIDSAGVEGLAMPTRSEEAVQIGPPLPPPPPSDEDLPANSGAGRRVVYSIDAQRVWAVEDDGKVVKTHRISGRLDAPRRGTYRVWSRSASTCAEHNPSICWRFMVRFAWGPNGGNVGFHEIPWQNGRPVQTVEQLGQPLSGGCVRQAVEDAMWMWDWAQIDTVVVVI